ncbi:RNB-domain-containing protein [Basidiobolus meristosporus CBS 931.73]|uniref:DIS3-like exonuclease 2 n=1 Tax=Basidiobolus meristosporus CBS 931.73 TaxID=1314790 RepID=A0A1Y1XYZ0_9FUNG|nr:RNB-domain-containing protein [Basidiobolus meristosporus CBS 931.73]|eukprot:ORX90875.1 RNB-domain-containing protein [Basidiobolus meristosporus CBS 931.73]
MPLFDSPNTLSFSSNELEVIDYSTLGVLRDHKPKNKPKGNQKPRPKAKNLPNKGGDLKDSKEFNEDHHAVPFDYSTLNSQTSLSQSPNIKTRKTNARKDKKGLSGLGTNVAGLTNDTIPVLNEKDTTKTPKKKKKASTEKNMQEDLHEVEDLAQSMSKIDIAAKPNSSGQQTSELPTKLPSKPESQSRAAQSKTPKKGKQTPLKSNSKKSLDKPSASSISEKLKAEAAMEVDGAEVIVKGESSRGAPRKKSASKPAEDLATKAEKEGNRSKKNETKTPRKQIRQKKEAGSSQTPKAARNEESSSKPVADKPSATVQKHKQRSVYEKYLTTKELAAGLSQNTIYRGKLRINKRNRSDAYVISDAFDNDIYIWGTNLRNRALEGDSVAVTLLEGRKLEDVKEQRAKHAEKRGRQLNDEDGGKLQYGEVVYIYERANGNQYSGTLVLQRPNEASSQHKKELKFVWFIPTDKRVPYIIIPIRNVPKDFIADPEAYSNQLLVASIHDWPVHSMHPFGKVVRKIGSIGNLAAETEALLADNNVRTEDFGPKVKECLPKLPWSIPKSEFKVRRDLRRERVFTIDPASAKDLDDAVSCRRLPDGNLEIGVHIADVTYFVKPGTALDREARLRATTVYLVEKAIPMLPHILCQELCSLNPGVDRLAFSVMWKMSPQAEVLDVWFGRTVINSCCRLAYEQAQEVILGKPLDPSITLYGQPKDEIETDIKTFYQLSQIMRTRRFESGALSINSIRLHFELNSDGIPTSCNVYDIKDSNRLIEEFMLLANISVAEKISAAYPEQAFLRRHPSPVEKRLLEFTKIAEELGYDIDIETAGALQKSLNSIGSVSTQHVLKTLCIKPMQRAKYFCAGSIEPERYRHYALNVPLYTHFTSPIRRYADVIVHRELQSALLEKDRFNESAEKIDAIANHCNNKKDSAKNAQETSSHIYLAVYLYNLTQAYGPIVCTAIVVDVVENGFDVLIPQYGIEKRIYLDKLPIENATWDSQNKTITLKWKKDTQVGADQDSDELPLDLSMDEICFEESSCATAVENDYSHLSSMNDADYLEECFDDSGEVLVEDNTDELYEKLSVFEQGDSEAQLPYAITKPKAPQSQLLQTELNFNLHGDTQTIKILGHVNALVTSDISVSPANINVLAVNPLVPLDKTALSD